MNLEDQIVIFKKLIDTAIPFGVLINHQHQILVAGRSFLRLIKTEDVYLQSVFEWIQKTNQGQANQDFIMDSETINIIGVPTSFRYKEIDLDSNYKLICLNPLFKDPKSITQLGLKYSDFALFDPIIDYVMLHQSMEMTLEDLNEKNDKLAEKNHRLNLITNINLARSKAVTREDFLSKSFEIISQEFNFDKILSFRREKANFVSVPVKFSKLNAKFEFSQNDYERWVQTTYLNNDKLYQKIGPDNKTLEVFIFIKSQIENRFDKILVLLKENCTQSLNEEESSLLMEISAYIGQFLDQIELLKQSEEQKAQLVAHSKMASLGEMAGGVAHEINNPLTVIVGKIINIERALTEPQPDLQKIAENLSKIKKMSDRITKIVHGLRLFSRNDVSDPMHIVELNKIINDTLDLCGEQLRLAAIDLKIDVADDIKINCRPGQISQVLLNLILNARDAILEFEEKFIHIEAKKLKDKIIINVTDSGLGIPEAVVEKLMFPFFTTKEPGKGTGLGLSISKGIIEGHGGALTYDKNHKNTRFVITLPLET